MSFVEKIENITELKFDQFTACDVKETKDGEMRMRIHNIQSFYGVPTEIAQRVRTISLSENGALFVFFQNVLQDFPALKKIKNNQDFQPIIFEYLEDTSHIAPEALSLVSNLTQKKELFSNLEKIEIKHALPSYITRDYLTKNLLGAKLIFA